MRAGSKDVWRSIKRERRRFLALTIITVLGVIMLTGLKSACVDLRTSADTFFDNQRLYDISVQSTLGLTKEDVDRLKEVDGVESAQGVYSETVYTVADGKTNTAEVKTFDDNANENLPYVLEGTLPEYSGEIAVTRNFISASGKRVGDKVSVTGKDDESFLKCTEFTITAVVIDPADVNSAEGAVSFRSTAVTDYVFFVTPDVMDSEIFTAVYLRISGASELMCYSDEYVTKVTDVIKNIDDNMKGEEAKKQIGDAVWYVQDRTALSGYANISSDSDSIEAIGTVFPIIFFLVAILISLTTVTRMVEEDRSLIGTYKALGFSDREIRRKYLVFAGGASLIGGVLGDFGGFVVLPEIVFTIFATMYQLPHYGLSFNIFSGIGGIVLFAGGVIGATLVSSHEHLKQVPSELMRPSAPRAGKIILMERITPLWKLMSFLNKVTARNIFRYKKRLFMTVGGIMGCTALLVCGFAIKDSVTELMPRQYEQINRYDAMAVASNNKLALYLNESNEVESWINAYITNVKITSATGGTETLQLIAIPDNAAIDDYVQLKDSNSGQTIALEENVIAVTKNLSVILDFAVGDTVSVQDLELNKKDIKINNIVDNYLGNVIYMSQSTYSSLFGVRDYNGALINYSSECDNQKTFTDNLASKDGITSAVSTESLKDEFASAFAMINMVVYIIIFMAACLAFVVLFTLCTTNISERERELSTIKVLGFYDNEVHLYVNKETLILTGIGIIIGLPVGAALGNMLTQALKLPSVYFAVSIHPVSFVISAVLAFVFAIVVDLITNRVIDKINPVEALKSIE